MRSSFSMPLLYHAYVYLEFLILACTIYILAPEELRQSKKLMLVEHAKSEGVKQRINELSEYIHSEDTQITEYDEN